MNHNANRICFTIADVTIGLSLPWSVRITPNFEAFEKKEVPADFQVEWIPTLRLPQCEGALLYNCISFSAYKDKKSFLYQYHDHKDNDRPYAVMKPDFPNNCEQIFFLPGSEPFFSESHNSFSHIQFEAILLHFQRLILHASLIDTPFGGILFSGPSGIGKSTQAQLWVKYAQARLINGDRPILGRKDGKWMAYGSPYAGSSRCFVNQKTPIRAVVMLEQGRETRLSPLSAGQAFRSLYAEITVHTWDKTAVEQTCDLLTDFAASVPMYRLTCTPDAGAVEILRRELEKGDESTGSQRSPI